MTENEKKKEYLSGYRDHIRRIRRIEAEVIELQEIRDGISQCLDGMPRGSNHSDLSSYVAEIDESLRELRYERTERYAAYKDIERCIKSLHNRYENDVLFYRYIKGLEWWEIAEKMRYSERHVTRLHGKGLEHIKIIKKCPVMSENVR